MSQFEGVLSPGRDFHGSSAFSFSRFQENELAACKTLALAYFWAPAQLGSEAPPD